MSPKSGHDIEDYFPYVVPPLEGFWTFPEGMAQIQAVREFALAEGYVFDEDGNRHHHEIYLSDPRRVSPERLKTVIRIPVKEA